MFSMGDLYDDGVPSTDPALATYDPDWVIPGDEDAPDAPMYCEECGAEVEPGKSCQWCNRKYR